MRTNRPNTKPFVPVQMTGSEAKPEGYVAPEPTILDKLLAGTLTADEVAESIIDDAYGPLKQFCSLPKGFEGRTLGYEWRNIDGMSHEAIDEINRNPPSVIIDPKESQVTAIELLRSYLAGDDSMCVNGDPYQPRFGVNLRGKPGCGKTHVMSAFAFQMKTLLDQKLSKYREMVTGFVLREYQTYQRMSVGAKNEVDSHHIYTIDEDTTRADLKSKKMPALVFAEKLEQFKAALARLQYQPSDLLYLDFDQLWELCRSDNEKREQAMDAIIRAKVLFLDDVHPKGDPERTQIVLHVIEGRYAAGRMGTFITTNLNTQELAGNDDNHVFDRLQSRCNEMFAEIEFKDCVDWRTQVRQRRITLVTERLKTRVDEIMAANQPPESTETSE